MRQQNVYTNQISKYHKISMDFASIPCANDKITCSCWNRSIGRVAFTVEPLSLLLPLPSLRALFAWWHTLLGWLGLGLCRGQVPEHPTPGISKLAFPHSKGFPSPTQKQFWRQSLVIEYRQPSVLHYSELLITSWKWTPEVTSIKKPQWFSLSESNPLHIFQRDS